MSISAPDLVFTDGSRMTLGTIYCIGRNFRDHAAEMKAQVPTSPLVFLKSATALVQTGSTVSIPSFSTSMHYEGELVVVVGSEANSVSPANALACVAGIAVGIDFTLRDVQEQAKARGEPWAVAKGFRGSAPLAPVVPYKQGDLLDRLEFKLSVNGESRQQGRVSDMERSIPMLLSYLSEVFGLRRGDCVFTGTPKGVGPVKPGDKIRVELGTSTHVEVQIQA